MTMRATGPDGRVYEFGPELWGDLNLPRDHSMWAKSVRWSCGRPGFTTAIRFEDDPDGRWRASLVEMRMRDWVGAQVMSPDASITVSAT